MSTETDAIKAVSAEIQKFNEVFHEFKKQNDADIAELKKNGFEANADAITKLNKRLDEAEELVKKTETALARAQEETKVDKEMEKKQEEFHRLMKAGNPTLQAVDLAKASHSEYKKNYDLYLRNKEQHNPDIRKALSVGINSDGGITVDPDTNGRMVKKIFETSPMRQVASVQSIGTDSLEGVLDLDEVGSGWVGETGGRPPTDTAKLQKWSIPTHEIYALQDITQKLLDDSSIDIAAWASDKVSDKFSREENAAFVNGNGVDRPRGFLTYPDGTTIPGTITRYNSGAAGGFPTGGAGADAIFDAVYGLKSAYRNRAMWATNRLTLALVRKIKDGDGNYIWQPVLQAGEPSTLAGHGIIEFQDMPDPGIDSMSMAFADWAEMYQIVERMGTRILVDPYSNRPFVQYYATRRVGGDVVNFEAGNILQLSA